MSAFPSLIEQLRSFAFQNKTDDMEQLVTYFTVFGGMGWDVDFNTPLEELITTKVLQNYRYIHGDITKITQSNKAYHAILTALALGDGREHSAFKRANVGRGEGEAAIDFLVDAQLIYKESSQARPLDENEDVSDRYHFTLPFMRFWFAFVSPYYKRIKEGEFSESLTKFSEGIQVFTQWTYAALAKTAVEKSFEEEGIRKIGAYWDKQTQIDLLAKTKARRVIAGAFQFSKSKAKKSLLSELEQKCQRIKLDVDVFVLFAKAGFSSELKKAKGETLKLLTSKQLSTLLKDLSEEDRIEHQNKKY